ncbi:MAG: response regulator [Candidatus Krumholzibacteriia bacterium]
MAFNILLVDDSLTVRAVIAKALQLAGVDIGNLYEAENGAEALKVLDQEWVDLVFADISMPVMTGEELVERLHESGAIKDLPVVIVSSAGNEPRIKRLRELGIRDYIHKPFTPEQIREVVDKVMGVTSHD